MEKINVIKNVSWIVAWDEARGSHRYLRHQDFAFKGNQIVQVGGLFEPSNAGADIVEIDGRGLMVMPGLIDIHSHPLSEPMGKGFGEDAGNPKLGMSGLYDLMPVYGPDLAGMPICAEVAYAELLKSGVTTLVDLSIPYPGWLELLSASGLRGVVAPMHRSARWYTENGHEVKYDWAEDGGRSSFESALATIDRALEDPSGRLSAMVTPAQLDTCTPELLKDSLSAARERGLKLQIHASQSLVEFAEITHRHGMTPIEWLRSLGLLTPDTIVAHAIFIDSHSWVYWGEGGDFERLVESGAAVAHCPNVFLRHGMLLESFAKYRNAGIPLGIGTDTFPHNFLEEMRAAALNSRVVNRRVEGSTTKDVFEAATLGGAAVLGRDDIGRLAVGAKADFVTVDLSHPLMQPLRDPLRSLIFTAAERAVKDVYIDGHQVVRDGEVLTLDYASATEKINEIAAQAEAEVPEKHWTGMSAAEISPLSFPVSL